MRRSDLRILTSFARDCSTFTSRIGNCARLWRSMHGRSSFRSPPHFPPHLATHALHAQRAPAITSSPNAHRNPPRASFRTLSCLDAPTSNIPPSHQHPHTHTRAWRREEESGSADASAACAETHTRVANALAHTHERCQWPRCRGHEEGVILGGAGTGVSRILGQVWQASVLGQEHRQVHRLFAEKLGVSTCSAAFA